MTTLSRLAKEKTECQPQREEDMTTAALEEAAVLAAAAVEDQAAHQVEDQEAQARLCHPACEVRTLDGSLWAQGSLKKRLRERNRTSTTEIQTLAGQPGGQTASITLYRSAPPPGPGWHGWKGVEAKKSPSSTLRR